MPAGPSEERIRDVDFAWAFVLKPVPDGSRLIVPARVRCGEQVLVSEPPQDIRSSPIPRRP